MPLEWVATSKIRTTFGIGGNKRTNERATAERSPRPAAHAAAESGKAYLVRVRVRVRVRVSTG